MPQSSPSKPSPPLKNTIAMRCFLKNSATDLNPHMVYLKKASHLMSSGNVKASPNKTVDIVLKRMARTGAKEIAVVDSDGRILADTIAIDLLKYDEL